MFVARRELMVVKNGKPYWIKPGEVIADFDQWDIHAHRAHLNNEWVEKVDEEVAEPKNARTLLEKKSAAKPAKKAAPKKQAAEKPMEKVKTTPAKKSAKATPKKADKKKDHATEE